MAEQVETVLSLLVADSARIDPTIFRSWVNGMTPRECARLREPDLYCSFFGNTAFDQLKADLKQRWRAAQMLNMQECQEEFQVCEWMAPYLCQPQQFQTQLLFNLERAQLREMIAEFYSFDESVMREFLGKTLNKTVMRELEDIAEQTNIPVVSVRRQFHNLKRIVHHVELQIAEVRDAAKTSSRPPSTSVSLLTTICDTFMLPVELSSQYIHVAFLAINRIETMKSRLCHLDFHDWNSLTGVVMAVWGSDITADLDTTFVDNMRLAKEKLSAKDLFNQYRKLSLAAFRQLIEEHQLWQSSHALSIQVREQATRQKMQSIDACFSLVIRCSLQIGAGLSEAREVKDLFIDIHEKILEPLHKADMTLEQAILLFQVLEKVLPQLPLISKRDHVLKGTSSGGSSPLTPSHIPAWAVSWKKCVEGVKMLIVTMYPVLFGRVA